jgi:WD40 repeat protein
LIWELSTRTVRRLIPTAENRRGVASIGDPESNDEDFTRLLFTPDGERVVASERRGIRVWDLSADTWWGVGPGDAQVVSGDGERIYASFGLFANANPGVDAAVGVRVYDLEKGAAIRDIPSHPNVVSIALDWSETILVTGGMDGAVRVGPVSGAEPHLLLGQRDTNHGVAVSPDGLWIASANVDGTVRVWPMPDVTKPPLHTLAHDELLASLKRLTNFRAVEDAESDSGYSIEYGPFPGWGDDPDWLVLAKDRDEMTRASPP